jgi:hypothetical protein
LAEVIDIDVAGCRVVLADGSVEYDTLIMVAHCLTTDAAACLFAL